MSLFVTLGLSPLACGGTVITASDADGGTPGAGGARADGGSGSRAGAIGYGGAPTYAGSGPVIAGAGGAAEFVCQQPTTDPVTHLVTCSNGVRHRPKAFACPIVIGTGADGAAGGSFSDGGAAGESSGDGGAGGDTAPPGSCSKDSDCAAFTRGYCQFYYDGGPFLGSCQSGCVQDSDCPQGVCICDGSATGGKCTYSDCTTDAQCGPHSLCASYENACGPGGFACLAPGVDECLTRADCAGSACSTEGGHRACNSAVCGRPFLVDAQPRIAPVAVRADWLASVAPDLTGLGALERAALAAHWSRLGQLEHASIAAFARFNLQLLSLGAPAELIEACNRALADETAHTRLCFALATAYGGIPVGPSKLEVRDCFEDMSLVAITKLVLREGCLGETVASFEAIEAAALASDAAVESALLRIARDERAHAELAFRFLRWALGEATPEERSELARESAICLRDFEQECLTRETLTQDNALAAHGVLRSESLRSIHLSALHEVVQPLLDATLHDALCQAVPASALPLERARGLSR